MDNKITMVKATNWEISQLVLKRSYFGCGDCGKLNRKSKVFQQRWANHSEILAVSQCQWCGIVNSFWDGNKPIIFE